MILRSEDKAQWCECKLWYLHMLISHKSYLTLHPEALKAIGSANRTWLMGPEWPDRVARDVDTSSMI